MPELPDVETWRRYVEATSLRHRIDAVAVDAPRMLTGISPTRLESALRGRSFERTWRHGKYLFVQAGTSGWLVLHFGMTGFLEYGKGAPAVEPPRRLSIGFSNGYRLDAIWRRRLGRIAFAASCGAFVEEQGLGPDVLDPALDEAAFAERLAGRRGTLKSAFMDQAFMAGLGNIYADEILFHARLHPRRTAGDLDRREASRLYRALHRVLDLAIERQAEPSRLPESWLLPRRKEGRSCPRCGGAIARTSLSGRSTYFCPACQKPPGG